MKAIAAMSVNRVIGRGGVLPWHLPEDLRWFRRTTGRDVLLMGRKTFESLRQPLRDRTLLVASHTRTLPGAETIPDLSAFDPALYAPREVWVIGGAGIYRQLLPRCSELILTIVHQAYEGDTFFPEFEEQFTLVEKLLQTPEFEVRRYRNTGKVKVEPPPRGT